MTCKDKMNLKALGGAVSSYVCAGVLLGSDFIPTLAQLIDRAWNRAASHVSEKKKAKNVTVSAKSAVCEETDAPVAAETYEAAVPVSVSMMEAVEVVEAEDDEEEENESFAGLKLSGLEFFDAKEEPDAYADLIAREAAGRIQIVTRYRRSFLSRLVQSQGEVQEYYSAIKNKLLSYKGVKGRISWGNESFNKGRNYIAKVNAKSKTLYLYLALDPAAVEAIEDGKYNVTDVSDKKKYANVPTLIKIKGPRKLKHALELIDMVCDGTLQLKPVKDYSDVDYTVPYKTTEELVEEGSIRMMVAGILVSDGVNEATDGDVTLA